MGKRSRIYFTESIAGESRAILSVRPSGGDGSIILIPAFGPNDGFTASTPLKVERFTVHPSRESNCWQINYRRQKADRPERLGILRTLKGATPIAIPFAWTCLDLRVLTHPSPKKEDVIIDCGFHNPEKSKFVSSIILTEINLDISEFLPKAMNYRYVDVEVFRIYLVYAYGALPSSPFSRSLSMTSGPMGSLPGDPLRLEKGSPPIAPQHVDGTLTDMMFRTLRSTAVADCDYAEVSDEIRDVWMDVSKYLFKHSIQDESQPDFSAGNCSIWGGDYIPTVQF